MDVIRDIWSVLEPFAVGYLIFFGLFFIAVMAFIVFIFVKVFKSFKEF